MVVSGVEVVFVFVVVVLVDSIVRHYLSAIIYILSCHTCVTWRVGSDHGSVFVFGSHCGA